jgi:hypothetical protein
MEALFICCKSLELPQRAEELASAAMSLFGSDLEWLDERIKKREVASAADERARFDPNLPIVDAGRFAQQIADLAETLRNKIEREGPQNFPHPNVTTDVGVILSQLIWTYNLLRWINADTTRQGASGYREAYTFVSLPLVRTLIDRFYNCTALLDDPSRSRSFRISGFFRLRRALREDEERYKNDPGWQKDFQNRHSILRKGLAQDRLTDADLDDRKNKWPLLGDYLDRKPDTPHKQLLRRISLGFWREYSSISHASYDGLVQLFPFIARDRLPHGMRTPELDNYGLRSLAMHFARAAVLLLCLLTEIQDHFKFQGANIDKRLRETWTAMLAIYEVKELFDFRYDAILREQAPPAAATSP